MSAHITQTRKGVWIICVWTTNGKVHYEKCVSLDKEDALRRAGRLIGANGAITVEVLK